MCCFKRLVARMKRKAGWGRKERPPAVSRPSQNEIDRKKENTQQGAKRNARRQVAATNKDEHRRRTEFFQKKGWLEPEEAL